MSETMKTAKGTETMLELIAHVRAITPRLAELGGWPERLDGEQSLVSRIPLDGLEMGQYGRMASGLDAGLACALGLIPEDRQRLSAALHGAYTEEAVAQVRREVGLGDEEFADTETCWWLAACSVCREGEIDAHSFRGQIREMHEFAENRRLRISVARNEFEGMKKKFVLFDGVPFANDDGGLQGAYVLGYDWGVWNATKQYGIIFIGTFRPTLGLENFVFSSTLDAEGRAMSGPMHGSWQFVKVSNFMELADAVELVRQALGEPGAAE